MEDNHISDERARTFAGALRRFEQDSDAAAFAELFTDDAVTQRLDARGERKGEVEQFWREYRGQFHDLKTTFYNVVEGGDQFALEWTSEGTLTNDRPVRYRGVTCVGYDGDKIGWLRTYYDSAVFAAPTAETA
ncbi:MAG TPA: nuclear transport factor 2 family protein [Pseudonocardia sp.]|nr:nuclear transport factor 2 family protein [Pseudonocardia sp.]